MIIFERDLLNDLAIDYLSKYMSRSIGVNGLIRIKLRSILSINEFKEFLTNMPVTIICTYIAINTSRRNDKAINVVIVLDSESVIKLLKMITQSFRTYSHLNELVELLRNLGGIFLNSILSALMNTKKVEVFHSPPKILITDDKDILMTLLRLKARNGRYADVYVLEFCSKGNNKLSIEFVVLLLSS